MKKFYKITSNITLILLFLSALAGGSAAFWKYQNPTSELFKIAQPIKGEKIDLNGSENAEYGASVELKSLDQMKAFQQNTNQPLYLRGYLNIPAIGTYQAIHEGTSDRSLAYGSGTTRPGLRMDQVGNYAIAGHNMADWGWGKSLGQTQPNPMIGLDAYTTDGVNIYTYKIVDKVKVHRDDSMKYIEDDFTERDLQQQIKDLGVKTTQANSIEDVRMHKSPKDREKSDDSDFINKDDANKQDIYDYAKLLTLYTCFETPPDYYHATHRIITRGVQTEAVSAKDAPQWKRDLFPDVFGTGSHPANPNGNAIEKFVNSSLANNPNFMDDVIKISIIMGISSLAFTIVFTKLSTKKSSDAKDTENNLTDFE